MKAYFERTKQEHDAERTRHLYTTLQSLTEVLHADSYMLPLETTADCARIQPGVKYKVTFHLPDNQMAVVKIRNHVSCDEVEIVDNIDQLVGPMVVIVEEKTEETSKVDSAPVEQPIRSEELLVRTANEWWKAYSEKLWQEIELVGEQPIILGTEYRLPCQEIKPFLDRRLRKESSGRFGFDDIDEDLIATVIPLPQEKETPTVETQKGQSKKPQSQIDKFNARQAKKEA